MAEHLKQCKTKVVKMKDCGQTFSNPRMQISLGLRSDVICVVAFYERVFYVTGSIIYYI